MRIEVTVNLDDAIADVVTLRRYYDCLDKYEALGIGHEKTGTSTMIMKSGRSLDIGELTRDLGNIEILSVGIAA
jgi:hypothetical protein